MRQRTCPCRCSMTIPPTPTQQVTLTPTVPDAVASENAIFKALRGIDIVIPQGADRMSERSRMLFTNYQNPQVTEYMTQPTTVASYNLSTENLHRQVSQCTWRNATRRRCIRSYIQQLRNSAISLEWSTAHSYSICSCGFDRMVDCRSTLLDT